MILLSLLLLSSLPAVSMLSTVDDYLAAGDEALSMDNLEEAIQMYKQGISLLPELKESTVSTKEGSSSNYDEEEQQDTSSAKTKLSLYTNLGTALSTAGRNQEAVKAYQQTLLAHKQHKSRQATDIAAAASFFLGMEYHDLENIAEAADAYEYATQLDPQYWAAHANLGSLLQDHANDNMLATIHGVNMNIPPSEQRGVFLRKALAAYNEAYLILTSNSKEPTDPPEDVLTVVSDLQYRIGLLLQDTQQKCAVPASSLSSSSDDAEPPKEVDCKEMATHSFALAVKYDPSNEAAKHMLASITADSTIERASNSYIKELFDSYATNFEQSLVQELNYSGYERLRKGFDRAMASRNPNNGEENSPLSFDIVVDAGCGTGLAGQEFRNISNHLIGVDLSAAIVEEATKRRPNLYDKTLVGDVTEHMLQMKGGISLIVAADSYIYFGDLQPLFAAMQAGLVLGGYAAFTLENVRPEMEASLLTSKPGWKWQLTASGRFAHRRAYVEKMAADNDFEVQYYETLDGFRIERGQPVPGHMFVLQKATRGNDGDEFSQQHREL